MRYVRKAPTTAQMRIVFKSVKGHKSRLRLMLATCIKKSWKKSKPNKIINESIMTSAWAVQSLFSRSHIFFIFLLLYINFFNIKPREYGGCCMSKMMLKCVQSRGGPIIMSNGSGRQENLTIELITPTKETRDTCASATPQSGTNNRDSFDWQLCWNIKL